MGLVYFPPNNEVIESSRYLIRDYIFEAWKRLDSSFFYFTSNASKEMDIELLEETLNIEKKLKEQAMLECRQMEKRVNDIKQDITTNRKQEYGGTDSEGYKQLQEQIQATARLEKNISLEKERLKILSERNADITEMDLDLLSQTELIRFVKQLERIRTDLQSNLREIQVNLDQQAQEYQRLNDMKHLYNAEMNLRDRTKKRQGGSSVGNPLSTTRT